MIIYNTARKINTQIKKYKKSRNGRFLSPCRRIEFVNPPSSGRFVAMTFDDGPTTMPTTSNMDKGLTDTLIDILNSYGAKGTFDIIGSTTDNYPDEEGSLGNFTWSGTHYDHYPKYNDDLSAGAVNQPQLIEKMLSGGHELTSHTYSHKLFGPMKAIYGKRHHCMTLSEVCTDLFKLHNYIKETFNYEMKLSRPPHYIDNIPDKSNSYDAYRVLGYNYMAASFDGAGWQPEESYEKEVSSMIEPLKRALSENPDSLSGKIIFQKDGCNMNLRTPVADALSEQLKLLCDYGYQVISVSDLIKLSPFEDVSDKSEYFPYIQKLLSKNYVIGYRNNTFKPDKPITKDEFMIMCADPEIFRVQKALSYAEMCEMARKNVSDKGIELKSKKLGNSLIEIALSKGIDIKEYKLKDMNKVKRADALELISGLID